jgi:hypothetical protein
MFNAIKKQLNLVLKTQENTISEKNKSLTILANKLYFHN